MSWRICASFLLRLIRVIRRWNWREHWKWRIDVQLKAWTKIVLIKSLIHTKLRKIKAHCFTITTARFFETRISDLIEKIFIIFSLIFLVIFLRCEEFLLFIEVLFTTFNQFSLNFFSFIHDDEKIAERRERFKHKYVFLKFDIKNVSDNLQLIINKKLSWFRRFNNNLNELTKFSFLRDIFHRIFLVHDYFHWFRERFSELFDQNLKSFLQLIIVLQ